MLDQFNQMHDQIIDLNEYDAFIFILNHVNYYLFFIMSILCNFLIHLILLVLQLGPIKNLINIYFSLNHAFYMLNLHDIISKIV